MFSHVINFKTIPISGLLIHGGETHTLESVKCGTPSCSLNRSLPNFHQGSKPFA